MGDERERFLNSSLCVKTLTLRLFEVPITQERELDNVLEDLEPSPPRRNCWDGFLLFGLPAIIAVVQALIPGGYRVYFRRHNDFFGANTSTDYTVSIIYIAISTPIVFIILAYLEYIVSEFTHGVVVSFTNVASLTNASDARNAHLPYYIDIADGSNIPRWLLLRQAVQRRVGATIASSSRNLAPVIALIVVIAIVVFVRVYVLLTPTSFDIFNLLAAVVMVTLTFYVARVLLAMANANSALLDAHLTVLRRRQYSLAREITDISGTNEQIRRTSVLRLLEKAEYNVANFDSTPVKIYGQAITKSDVNKLISLATAAIVSALSDLMNVILKRRGAA
jgi:hypothetical protein